jgi:hypothetical protein
MTEDILAGGYFVQEFSTQSNSQNGIVSEKDPVLLNFFGYHFSNHPKQSPQMNLFPSREIREEQHIENKF